MDEEDEALAVKVAVIEATHGLRPLATAAAIVTVTLDPAVSLILTSLLVRTEAAVQLAPRPTPGPGRAAAAPPEPGGLLDAAATIGAGHPTADLDRAPVPAPARPPTAAAEKTGDTIWTMVIMTDPITTVNHLAHFIPDEASPERVLPPEA